MPKVDVKGELFLSVPSYVLFLFFFHSKKKQCALYGKWTESLYAVDPAAFEAHKKNTKKGSEEKKVSKKV